MLFFLNRPFLSGLISGCLLDSTAILAFLFFGFFYYKDYPNGRLMTCGKDFIKETIHKHHPLAEVRSYVQEVKADIKQTSTQNTSDFSAQKIGFSRSRVEESGDFISVDCAIFRSHSPGYNPSIAKEIERLYAH